MFFVAPKADPSVHDPASPAEEAEDPKARGLFGTVWAELMLRQSCYAEAWDVLPEVKLSNSAPYFPPNSAQNFPVHAVIFGCFFLCLNRKESFPVSRISQ